LFFAVQLAELGFGSHDHPPQVSAQLTVDRVVGRGERRLRRRPGRVR
jgi:hypothetical protein